MPSLRYGVQAVFALLGGAAALSCARSGTEPLARRTPASYAVTAAPLSPDAGATASISAVLSDSSGKAIPQSGNTVLWSATGAGFSFATPTSLTDATGTATVVFTTGPAAGNYVVTATDNNAITGSTPTITSVAVHGHGAQYLLTVSPTSPVANTAVTITARLADAYGALVATPGRTVSWKVAAVTYKSSTTDATGAATLQFTMPAQIDTLTFTATDSVGFTGTSQRVIAVPAAASALKSVLAASPTTALPADGKARFTATLQAKDAYGNSVHTSSGTAVIAATPCPVSSTTDNQDGTYTATLTSTTWGICDLSFTLGGTASPPDVADVLFSRLNPTQYIVTSSAPSPVAGSSVTLTAQLADSAGNAITQPDGVTLTWSATGLVGTFTNSSGPLNAAGIGTITYTTSATPGLATVSVVDNFNKKGSLQITSVAASAMRDGLRPPDPPVPPGQRPK